MGDVVSVMDRAEPANALKDTPMTIARVKIHWHRNNAYPYVFTFTACCFFMHILIYWNSNCMVFQLIRTSQIVSSKHRNGDEENMPVTSPLIATGNFCFREHLKWLKYYFSTKVSLVFTLLYNLFD